MYGLDLSFTRRDVAFVLNFAMGCILCVGAFVYIHFGHGLTAPVLAAVAAAGYIVLWQALVPFVDGIEPGTPDPRLFARGAVAFIYGALSFLGTSLVLASLWP